MPLGINAAAGNRLYQQMIYAFCYEFEKDAAAVFDKAGLAAFERQIRARFEAATENPSSSECRRASAILRAIYCAQRDVWQSRPAVNLRTA